MTRIENTKEFYSKVFTKGNLRILAIFDTGGWISAKNKYLKKKKKFVDMVWNSFRTNFEHNPVHSSFAILKVINSIFIS